jgi:HEAT repeat protein
LARRLQHWNLNQDSKAAASALVKEGRPAFGPALALLEDRDVIVRETAAGVLA